MEAKKVLTLLNEQNYDELRRLCTLELCTKARKSTAATDKARIKLAKNCAKEMENYRPSLAGAFMWNGKQAICNSFACVAYNDIVEGLVEAPNHGNPLDLSEFLNNNGPELELTEQIDLSELYALCKAAKIGKDKKFKPLAYIAGAYYDIELLYEYASTLTGTFKYRKGAGLDPRNKALLIEGDNGKAFVLPVRMGDGDNKAVIKEYRQKPYIFPELVGANREHVFYRDKKTYALYTDWAGEIWYCGDAYGDIDFNSRLILPKYPVDGVQLVTD